MAGIPINFGGGADWGLIVGTVAFIFFIVAGLGAFIWYIWRELQFKIPIIVHETNDNGIIRRQFKDKARKLRTKGRNVIFLKKLKEEINNPPNDFYVNNGKQGLLYFRWDGGHVLVPQKPVYNSPLEFHPATYNILVKMANRISTSAKRHGNEGFWTQYGHIVVWMGVVILTAITLWILFTKLEIVAGAINNYAGAVKSLSNTQVVT